MTHASDTPRTDKAEAFDDDGRVVTASFARTLERELAQARETNQRLQRRCHEAEGLVAKFKLVEGRPQTEHGRSFGRALANYAASLYMRERDEARACLREMCDEAPIDIQWAPANQDKWTRWRKAAGLGAS